jgi:amino acid adenylation domain-containing protein
VTTGIERLVDTLAGWEQTQPAATAVTAPDGKLTFGELAAGTRAFARRLTESGVGPGTAVGLFLGRSRLSLPSLLGVWWSGATAVLVDERHPADRINFMLRDAGAEVLVGERVPAGAAPAHSRTLYPDLTGEPFADAPAARPDGCAYVVYTSGTTGWPKGVEVSYANLAVFLDALGSLGLPRGGLGINAVSPAFDGWLWCTLLYVLHGQGMALVDLTARDAGAGLSDLVEVHAPRTVCLTPTLLAALERVPAAEVVVVAGEPCPEALTARLAPVPRLLNVYGPTETTIAATWADTANGGDPRTIGRPLPGYRVYVLDETGAPVADGEVGELHIGGGAVALGYRNRPELTAERFLPDPFIGGDARMYRSGDLVRVRPDGQIEFCGRADGQIKVRGLRIELGEIETVATGVDGVRSAAAFAMPDGDTVGLAVTLAPDADPAQCVEQVRRRCTQRLPEAMRPSVVDVVDVLPALPTGKVDRAALARTAGARIGGRPPETELERQICEVWSGLLARPVDDVDANFFEIGGHSLLAARAVNALRRRTGRQVSMRHLLDGPTAAALSRAIEGLDRATPDGR